MKSAAIIAALLLSLSTADAACVLDLRYVNGEVRWTPVAGAARYQVQESFNDFVTSRNFFTNHSDFPVRHRVTVPTTVAYRVTTEMSVGAQAAQVVTTPTLSACIATINIPLDVDQDFSKLTGRAILPVVGSTEGALGGKFKTSLRMTASVPGQKGRVFFHPAGQVASESDPSRAYSFAEPWETIVFDDIVAELGASGLGSLEIVPDAADPIVPQIEARVYYDTPGGTFGTSADPVFPFDYLRVDGFRLVAPADPRFRVNVGFRTITDTVVGVLIYGADRRIRGNRAFSLPAGWMQMTTIDQVAGGPLAPGESIQLSFTGGVVPFYTITENRTNDPTLIVAPPRTKSLNVGKYVE